MSTPITVEVTVTAEQVTDALIKKLQALAAASIPRIGQPWPEKGGVYAGIIRGEGQDYHIVVAADSVQNIPWGESDAVEGAKSEYDGLSNTRAICSAEGDFPAARWASGLRTAGFADWYLPARRELPLLYANVPELFEKEWYWSSTQSAAYSGSAWGQDFTGGYQGGDYKDYRGRARAVRRFSVI